MGSNVRLSIVFITVLGLVGCGTRSEKRAAPDSGTPGSTDDSTTGGHDSAATETGGGSGLGDFRIPEPDPDLVVDVVPGTRVTCADPTRRDDLGPYALVEDLEGLAAIPHFEGGLPGATMSAALGDVNGDGELDLLHGTPSGVVLFYGATGGFFTRAPHGAWPVVDTEGVIVSGIVLVDLDDDGDLDAVVTHRSHLPARYMNGGEGTFDVHFDVGGDPIETGHMGAAVADIDGDGALDLFTGGHQTAAFEAGDPPVPMAGALYSLAGARIAPSPSPLPERAHDGYTFVATLLDFDDDGRTDAYLANDHGAFGPPNALLWGTGTAPDVTWQADDNAHFLDVHMAGMGIAPGDLNHDGIADLAVSNWAGPKLFLSDTEHGWFESALTRGLVDTEEATVGWGTHMGDFDNDADLDIYMAYGYLPGVEDDARPNESRQPDRFFENDGDGYFTDIAPALGIDDQFVGRTVLQVDLNHDGFLDLYLGRQFRPPKVWLARCSDAHWLSVRLEQPAPNSDAIGAKVQLVTATGVQTRWIQAGGQSFGGAPPLLAHFGLGAEDQVEQVVVTWPDGKVSASPALDANQEVRVVRRP